jgi:hypothetical protein
MRKAFPNTVYPMAMLNALFCVQASPANAAINKRMTDEI